MTDAPILQLHDLRVSFPGRRGPILTVDGVGWGVAPGRTLVVLGESGSGKSVSALAVAGLLPDYATVEGEVVLGGRDLRRLRPGEMRRVRAEELGMIFQDPQTSLNPTRTVGSHLAELFTVHRGLGAAEAHARAVELLEQVRIDDPERRARELPQQLSGGMRQRVVIALALALEPSVIIADEPTTALDTTVQASVLATLRDLQAARGTAMVFITHDIGVAAAIADEIAVMYAGRVVETGPATRVLTRPAHPYTAALLSSTPRIGMRRDELRPIEGQPPQFGALGDACPFAPRCPFARDACLAARPPLTPSPTGEGEAACVRSAEIADELVRRAPERRSA